MGNSLFLLFATIFVALYVRKTVETQCLEGASLEHLQRNNQDCKKIACKLA